MATKEKKKTFKEIHGKGRLGMFLKDKGPDLLKTILGVAGGLIPGASGVADTISGLIKGSDLPEDIKQEALDMWKMDLEDIQNARKMYMSTDHEMADEVARKVISYNLWVAMGAIVIEIFSVIYIDDKILIAIISSAIASFTTALLQERQQVINFFFGSSRGSKDKQKELNR